MRTCCVIATLLAFSLPGGAQLQVSPTLKKGGRKICSMLVLPAQFTVLKIGFRGSNGLWEKNDETEDEMTALVAKMLASHSATVSQTRPVTELASDRRSLLAQIQRRYDELDAQLERSPGGVRKGRYGLGDVVAAYPPAATVDTLVFIRGGGQVPANAGGAFTHRFGFKSRIGFVDSRTGNLLALISLECTGGHGRSTSAAGSLAVHLSDSLKENPSLYASMADKTTGACAR